MGWRILRGAIILLLSLAAGFAFGRFGLGEGYLKRSVASIQEQPEPKPIPSTPLPPEKVPELIPDIPAIIEEAPETAAEEGPEAAPEQAGSSQQSKPGTPPDTQAAAPTGQFSLQVGSFDKKESAYQHAEMLTSFGYPARIAPGTVGARMVYRVLVGSYDDEASARAAAEQLREKGLEAFISRQ